MKVLIIEDEPHAQREMKRLLKQSGHEIEIEGFIDSVEETVEWLSENSPPDLLFLDIQLSDGLSFEIFNKIKVKIPVIFTTAYDEYAIRAFKVNSVDYLLKPIKQAELNAALQKYEEVAASANTAQQVLTFEQVKQLIKVHSNEYKKRFMVKTGEVIRQVRVEEIAYFSAEDNEVVLVTKNNNRFIVDYSLDQLVPLLDPGNFFRANRSYIVSNDAISKISKYFNSRLHLELSPSTGDMVLISRVKVPEFLKWIDK